MSEQNSATQFGEKLHKWIGIGSIAGVLLVTVILALTGSIEAAL